MLMIFSFVSKLSVFLAFCFIGSGVVSESSLGIPGTTSTISGYDTELGRDPICWRSQSFDPDKAGEVEVAFPNELIEDFTLGGEVTLLEECPYHSVNLTIDVPEIFITDQFISGFRPRTKEYYNFRAKGSVNSSAFQAKHFVSDNGSRLVVQVILCRLDATGFCSPFVHEQSNARDAANNVTTKPGKGDLHGGTHVHSTTEVVILSDDEEYHEFDIEVPLIVNTPGSFFVISAVQFFVGNASEFYLPGASITRYDIGNSAAQRVVVFEEPAEVNDIQQGVAIGLYIITALSCFVILFLLEEAIRHRKNQIMKLSQGAFLIVLLLAALLATACVPISNPTISDLMCQLSPPLIAIPLQLIYAIIIGRVWRTQQVLSPLLSEFYETPISSVFGKVIRFLACAGKRTNSLKATVTNRQLATAVFVLTLPQVFIHTFALIFQPRRIEIMYTDDASVGRQQCGSDGRDWLTLVDFGYYTIFLMNIVLLVVAQGSKRLPSLFNEMQMIVGMSWTNFIVLLIGITILVVTNTPSTPPDVSYIIWAMVILSITLNSSIRLMYPKLRMIWNGETVLVSKLVTDHKKTVAAKRKNDSNFKSIRSKLMKGVTGFSMRASYNSPARDERTPKETVNSGFSSDFPSGNENSEAEKDVEGAFNDDSNTPIQLNGNLGPSGHDSNGSILEDTLAVIAFEEGEPFARRPGQADDGISPMEAIKEDIEISTKQPRRDAETTRKPSPETSSEYASAQPPKKRMPSKRSKSHRVLVGDQHTPSRTLVVPMVKLQEKLIAINTRVTTGLSVSHKEWEELRSMTAKLGEKFSDEVTFEWEQTMPQPSIS